MEINDIELTNEKVTLFITLYAKSLDYQSKRPILNDKTANDIMNSLNYDFSKYKGFGGNVSVIRTKQIDDWTNEFIKINKNAIVLNLGCGLDARVNRINAQSSIAWYDIDFPEVIKLRKNYYINNKSNYFTIETSISDENWYKNIRNDLPTIIVADGVFEYLTSDEIKKLFDCLTKHFIKGEIIFDVMNTFAGNMGKKGLKESTGAQHKWLVDDTREIDNYSEKIKRINDISVFNLPCIKNIRIGTKIFCKMAFLIKKYRNMLRLLRYEF